jgi:hypothetical protein
VGGGLLEAELPPGWQAPQVRSPRRSLLPGRPFQLRGRRACRPAPALQGLDEQQALELYQRAYDSAAAEQQQEVEAAAGGAVGSLPASVQAQLLQLKVRGAPWGVRGQRCTRSRAAGGQHPAAGARPLPGGAASANCCTLAHCSAGHQRGAGAAVAGVCLHCGVW